MCSLTTQLDQILDQVFNPPGSRYLIVEEPESPVRQLDGGELVLDTCFQHPLA